MTLTVLKHLQAVYQEQRKIYQQEELSCYKHLVDYFDALKESLCKKSYKKFNKKIAKITEKLQK